MSGFPRSTVVLGETPALAADTDLLAVPVFGDPSTDDLADLPGLDEAAGGALARARSSGEFRSKRRETFATDLRGTGARAGRLLLVGAPARGPGADPDGLGGIATRIAEAAAVAGRVARTRRIARAAFVCRGPEPGVTPALAQAAAEGLVIGGFRDTRYKSDEGVGEPPISQVVQAAASRDAEVSVAVERGAVLGGATNVARELANEPSNVLTPRAFAERAVQAVEAAGVKAEVLDEAAIRELGMGLFLGVAQGSREPPRLLAMRHEPPGAPAEPVLGLIGKGVTFDTGGISIKPAGGMEWMKCDMAGGAAVVGAMCAIGALGAPRRVVGVVPMTENMPGGGRRGPGTS